MTRLASALAIVAAVVAPTSAFSPAFSTKLASRTTTSLKYHPAKFERAVDCADTFGKCSIEEMLELSDELEDFQGCFYENGDEACEKEIDDRKDLADALLLQCELQERNRYVKEGNLFAYDVKADADMHDRDQFFDNVAPCLDI